MKNKKKAGILAAVIVVVLAVVAILIVAFGGGGKESSMENGQYEIEVVLSGGSGKAYIEAPAVLNVTDEGMTAVVTWSSPNYEYMRFGEEYYYCINTEGNSTFEIPVQQLDTQIPVVAQTVAMSEPHEITYTLYFDSQTIKKVAANAQSGSENEEEQTIEWGRLEESGNLELQYAREFSVDYYGEYALITIISDGSRFLVVPENSSVPVGLDEDIVVLQQPIENIYLVATAVMDFFDGLQALDTIRLSGTQADGWYIESAVKEMEAGNILYAGKYSEPDYEMIVSENCGLSIQSSMILHSPEIREKLQELGIPVLVDYSSYESHPLGRTEWVKLYGVLTGKTDEAQKLFDKQVQYLEEIENMESTGKKVAFFYITSSGTVVTRKSGDYVAKMIQLAGGEYVSCGIEENDDATSTVKLEMEQFYSTVKDADYIIYNSTVGGELQSMEDFLAKSDLLADFRAVQEGNVWCLGKNMYQETLSLGEVIADIHNMLTYEDNADSLNYMYRLK